MAVVVHHLNVSRSERIPWVLEELSVPYQVQVHYRDANHQAPKTLWQVNPLGKAPCITIDGKLLTESGVIVHTLLNSFPNPTSGVETTTSPQSNFWNHFSEGSLMSILQGRRVAQMSAAEIAKQAASPEEAKGAQKVSRWFGAYSKRSLGPMLEQVELFLAANKNFSGNSEKLGEGDFMMGWALMLLAPPTGQRPFPLGPATEDYIKRIRSRPAYKRALERMDAEEKGQRGAKL
ncbi:uncharacterized protein EHS24_006268 [Apiotrichum porosum]|uniref:GST N-terminal domain-containing protein n=1 Tax=Apiotrichum porosum TaxID=105984 RepID=A0A427Y0R0_9TREE|nr:uncharacterized protein EHS24_006268 [Apiotrichum porosum]RSH84744.1 hypothetical protein EHS24_006268 [Apiotrichum porosum]